MDQQAYSGASPERVEAESELGAAGRAPEEEDGLHGGPPPGRRFREQASENKQSKKPDEIEGWEPPKLILEDVSAGSGDASCGHLSRLGWQDDAKGSTKYTGLASSANSSRWSLRSAGKLVSIRQQSKGHLTDSWEEVEWRGETTSPRVFRP
ncbi:hypothetical protein TREES_T100020427 [Tupaia chinensis]|uniref:Testis development-related protein n=1 Tax=Tupaia chinensis TaxID=246437 RepID=L9KVU8_TUPCH|nr:hypothetical protein TREES_T100020427 [Tupaia chinensis]